MLKTTDRIQTTRVLDSKKTVRLIAAQHLGLFLERERSLDEPNDFYFLEE